MDLLAWGEWQAIIAFDSNAASNAGVRSARRALAEHLAGRGASVRLATVPMLDGINDPDDLVAIAGDDAAVAMLDTARPFAECALPEAEAAIAALEACNKSSPPPGVGERIDPLLVVDDVAAGADDARQALLIGKLAALKISGLTKQFIPDRVCDSRAAAATQRRDAAEAARKGRLLGMRVEGGALLDAIGAFARRFHLHTLAQNLVFALAVLHSYCIDVADYSPIIHATAPDKRCGKTRLLEVAKLLVWAPWETGRTSAAALVSKLADRCTLLLDETDAALQGDPVYVAALRAILDGRYERGNPLHDHGSGAGRRMGSQRSRSVRRQLHCRER
ncbi:MAG TPA: hypothetical protein VMV31_06720 [Terriglobales bacterium]|nr:hypothetical protein [Terriglobales bacterium]